MSDSPEMTHVVVGADTEHDLFPGEEYAVYEVTGEPPSFEGADQLMVIEVEEATVAEGAPGADGAVGA